MDRCVVCVLMCRGKFWPDDLRKLLGVNFALEGHILGHTSWTTPLFSAIVLHLTPFNHCVCMFKINDVIKNYIWLVAFLNRQNSIGEQTNGIYWIHKNALNGKETIFKKIQTLDFAVNLCRSSVHYIINYKQMQMGGLCQEGPKAMKPKVSPEIPHFLLSVPSPDVYSIYKPLRESVHHPEPNLSERSYDCAFRCHILWR